MAAIERKDRKEIKPFRRDLEQAVAYEFSAFFRG